MLKHALTSVFRNRCPRCNKGKVFVTDNAFNLKRFADMYPTCSCCGERYEREPGYFYGAMYVSYALTVGWFIVTWAINSFFIHAGTWSYIAFIAISMVLLMTLTMRVSRLIWLNLFTRYDETKAKCDQNPPV